jgi:hypothetical protein
LTHGTLYRVLGIDGRTQDEIERSTNYHLVLTAFENIDRYDTDVHKNVRDFTPMLQTIFERIVEQMQTMVNTYVEALQVRNKTISCQVVAMRCTN